MGSGASTDRKEERILELENALRVMRDRLKREETLNAQLTARVRSEEAAKAELLHSSRGSAGGHGSSAIGGGSSAAAAAAAGIGAAGFGSAAGAGAGAGAGGGKGGGAAKGLFFEDPEFPCTQQSIHRTGGSAAEDAPAGASRVVQWLRPSEIAESVAAGAGPAGCVLLAAAGAGGQQAAKGKGLAGGAAPREVSDPGLTDAWFVGTLAAVALRDPEHVAKRVIAEVSRSGRVACRFFTDGEWREVVVDDRLPCAASGEPVFARSASSLSGKGPGASEFWVSVVQKAYAKLCGAYSALSSGDVGTALLNIAGGVSYQRDLEDEDTDVGELWEELVRDAPQHVLLATVSGKARRKLAKGVGLLPRHPYPVVEARTVSGRKLVRVRNIWGGDGWSGPWAAADAGNWTASAKAEAGFDPADGTFWMPYIDFTRHFSTVDVGVRMGADDWRETSVRGEWRGASAGGFFEASVTGKFNPQFAVDIPSRASRVVFSLLQADSRFARRGVKDSNFAIGMHVLAVQGGATRPLLSTMDPDTDDLVGDTSEWCDQTEVSVSVDDLESGTYVVVPSTFDAGMEGEFTLRVFTSGGIVASVRALPPLRDTMASKSVAGSWSGGSGEEGGSMRYESWVTNPQFSLSLAGGGSSNTADAIVTVAQGGPDADPDDFASISFYALRGGSDAREVFAPDKVAEVPAFVDSQEVVGIVPLRPGSAPTMIVPCAHKPGHKGKFTVTVWGPKAVASRLRLSAIDPTSRWHRVVVDGQWRGATAGGTVNNEASWPNNPTLAVKVLETTTAAIVLGQLPPAEGAPGTGESAEDKEDDGKGKDEKMKKKKKKKAAFAVGFHVLDAEGEIVAATDEWKFLPTVTTTVTLKKGEYSIRPSTYEPKCECKFKVRFFTDKEVLVTAPTMGL